MKKFLVFLGLIFLSASSVSALSCADIQNNLQKGSETSEVSLLQNFLMQKGFLMVAPNGYFGPSTHRAVVDYQNSIGLPAFGFVYPLTRAAIKSESCSSSSNSVTETTKQNTVTSQPTTARNNSSSCVDLQNDLIKGAETSDVYTLQNFLMKKGFLMVAPNGYFGPSTNKAVIDYQSSIGLPAFGFVYPLTRSAIRDETCNTSNTSSNQNKTTTTTTTTTNTNSNPPVKVIVTTPPVATTTPVIPVKVVPLTNNQKRQADVDAILNALYSYFKDNRNTYPVPYVLTTPTEICALGIQLCVKDSVTYIEISSLVVPNYLPNIPRDPTITSVLSSTTPSTKYSITRAANNEITITAMVTDGGASIYAKCNFDNQCKRILPPTTPQKPVIETIEYPTFPAGGSMSATLNIYGSNFSTSSNTILLTSNNTWKTYNLGDFKSATGTLLNATTSFTISPVSCGSGCSEIPPAGVYNVMVKNIGGESNIGYLSLKTIRAGSVSNGADATFVPNTTHMKFGTLTLSSDIPITLKSLNITLDGTSSLVNKVTNFTITNTVTDQITNGGPNFTLPADKISNNQNKIYDLFANIGVIENYYAGRIVVRGSFTVTDDLGKRTIVVPIPSFMITISY